MSSPLPPKWAAYSYLAFFTLCTFVLYPPPTPLRHTVPSKSRLQYNANMTSVSTGRFSFRNAFVFLNYFIKRCVVFTVIIHLQYKNRAKKRLKP